MALKKRGGFKRAKEILRARPADQCHAVRLESRSREFVLVARLILLREKPQGSRDSAARKGEAVSDKRLSHRHKTRNWVIYSFAR